MGQAMVLRSVADDLEEVAVSVRSAVPAHWTGDAAQNFQRTATSATSGITAVHAIAQEAARLAQQHEWELTAVRAALSSGAPMPV